MSALATQDIHTTDRPVGKAVSKVERVLVVHGPNHERQGPERLHTRPHDLVLEITGVRSRAVPPHTLPLRPHLLIATAAVWRNKIVAWRRVYACSSHYKRSL